MDTDTIIIVTCLVVLLFYQICFYIFIFKFKAGFQLTRNLRNAFNWLTKHEEKQDAPSVTLAIQTLRNTILIAVFIGGQSFVYGCNSVLALKEDSSTNARLQSTIISSCLFLSFLNWANVIRYASHLGYLIGTFEILKRNEVNRRSLQNVENGVVPGEEPPQEADSIIVDASQMLDMMQINFSLGFRFIYMAIPFFLYSGGSIVLVIATFVILLFVFLTEPSASTLMGLCSSKKSHQ